MMDSTTTLMTFMLQASSNTRAVQLIGSWDNFAKRYPMEKDVRRGHREWRGCYSFKDIICDGDSVNSSKRNGGLKMGHTYYYYYEMDDGTEIHDPTLPCTTACQYLPGQPVNILWVPIEMIPLRERRASVGAKCPDLKTMNPADKYLTPRPPPPTPTVLPRLNTSPLSLFSRKRRASSASPVSLPWPTRVLFGLKSTISAVQDPSERGRLISPLHGQAGDAHVSYPTSISSSVRTPVLSSTVQAYSRDTSTSSTRKATTGHSSPLPRPTHPEHTLNPISLPMAPPEIAKDEPEVDDNFASPSRHIYPDKPAGACLPPHPARRDLPSSPQPSSLCSEAKPLPMLPEDASPSLTPSSLHIAPQDVFQQAKTVSKLHFSFDSISIGLISPTDSHFDCSSPSTYDSNDEDLITDEAFDFGFFQMELPILEELQNETRNNPFHGYTLPLGSDVAITKRNSSHSSMATPATGPLSAKPTLGPQVLKSQTRTETTSATPLDELLAEMGYLGDIISGCTE